MGEEILTLKTTGGRLWNAVREPITSAIAQLAGGPHDIRLGGGTTLAGRWEHRDSYDIDLTVSTRVNLRDLAHPDSGFADAMRRLGGDPSYHNRQWKIGFESGEVDLAEIDPVPPGGERRTNVNGEPAIVLTNAQILEGKLQRAERSPVRDVFDFIKARDLDPQALAIAVNSQTRQEVEVISINLELANATLGGKAKEQLRGVPDRFAENHDTLGTRAAEAIRGAVYRHVAVSAEDGHGLVHTRTNSGATHRIEIPGDRIDEAFTASGLTQYFRLNAWGGEQIRQAIHHACSTGSGTQTIWETGMRPPRGPTPRTEPHGTPNR